MSRLNQYRVMWLVVLFDLPTYTPQERKMATKFRNDLLKEGFFRLQFSVYVRHCLSKEYVDVHKRRVKNLLPQDGNIGIFTITDKQFGLMEIWKGTRYGAPPEMPQQLELF